MDAMTRMASIRGVARRLRSDRGAELIEFALVLPLLLLLIGGIADFAFLFHSMEVTSNAAREGARIAVLPGTTDANVTDRVRTYMSDGQLADVKKASVNIKRDATIPVGIGTASASRITIQYPFTFMVLQPVAQLVTSDSPAGGALTMTASALMRND